MRRCALILFALGFAMSGPGLAVASENGVEPFRPQGVTAATGPGAAAKAAIDQRPALFDGAEPEELAITRRTEGLGDVTVVRLEQRIDGVPVLGGQAVVALDEANRVVAGSGEILPGPGPDTTARISAAAARSIALRELAATHGAGLEARQPELVIFDPTLFGGPGLPGGTLVWDLVVERFPDVGRRVLVDADTGAIVLNIEERRTALVRRVCDGLGTRVGTTGQLPCADSGTPARVEGGSASPVAEVNEVYDDLGATYAFFAGLGRDSIDDQGMTLYATVRACPADEACPYRNAYWSSGEDADASSSGYMVFGEGFGSALDVTAHELTHGVTDAESELFYWYQSGAINESLSDVFGEFIELSTEPGAPGDRWLMGEDLNVSGMSTPFRDMENPNAFYDPASTDDQWYYTGTGDNGGVHYNSGVGNRAASLMVDGGTHNTQVVEGIGLQKAAWIWYQASRLLRSGSDYADLAVALQDGCQALIGRAGITSADCTQVGNAVVATRMLIAPPAAPVPQAPVCSSGVHTLAWGTSFEGGAPGWTVTFVGSNRWYTTASPSAWWRMAASGRDNVWAYDAHDAGEDSRLISPAQTIPPDAYLRFSHAHGFDSGEGGVVEYTTNNGATWIDIAGLPVDRGYNGTVAAGAGALSGRSAYVGSSQGLSSTRVDLSSLAGESVRFRFRFATVTGNRNQGWFVDDVAIYTCPTSATTTDTTVTVASSGGVARGSVLMVPSGQDVGTSKVFCRYGDNDCSVPSSAGSFVTLQATPDPDAYFAGWSGACSGLMPTCAVTADAARSVTATFAYAGTTPPGVASFVPLDASLRVARDVRFQIAFDEPVSGFGTDDLSVVGTGTATCSVDTVSGVDSATFEIALDSCSGVGTVRLAVAADAVVDATNAMGPWSSALSDAIEFVASTPPQVTGFSSAGATTTTDLNPVFRLDFDEDVTGIDASSFSVITGGGLFCGIDDVIATSASSYRIALACVGTGTVQLELMVGRAVDAIGSIGPPTALASATITIVAPADPDPPPQEQTDPAPNDEAPQPPATPAPPVAPVLRAASVTWVAPSPKGVVATRFPAAPGTSYSMSATLLRGRAKATIRKGACKVRKGSATCSVRLTAKGSWRVEITPVRNGVKGTPVRRTVRVR